MLRGEGGGGRYFALKSYSKARLSKVGETAHVLREKKALCALQPHPFVVSLHATFQDSTTVYFLLSLGLGGDLRGELVRHQRRQQPMAEPSVAFHVGILVMVLGHLHSRGYAYRDLKPENVLIDSQGYALLCDFGTAVHLGQAGRSMTIVGTWEYAAPEQLEERGSTMASDWWALGVVLLESLSNKVPFPSGDEDDPLRVIRAIRDFAHDGGNGGGHSSGGGSCSATAPAAAGGGQQASSSGSGGCGDSRVSSGGGGGGVSSGSDVDTDLGKAARQLVRSLLQPDESARWAAASSEQLRGVPFFAGLDWEALAERRVAPPTVPALLGDADTRNFSHCSLAEGSLDEQVGLPLDAGALSSTILSRAASHESDLDSLESRSKRHKVMQDYWEGF